MNALLSLAAFMAMMQNDDTDTDKAKFMDQYGPDKATRIALDRDSDGVASIIFSNVDGPKPDGATEMLQAAKVWQDGDTASVLFQLQRITHRVGALDDEEKYNLTVGMAEYLDRQPTVILLAKIDKELDGQNVSWFSYVDDGQATNKTVDMKGFLVKGDWAYVQIDGKIAKMKLRMLEANLVNGVKSLLTGATKIIDDIPLSAKLARGLKVDLGNGKIIDTVAYVTQNGDGDTAKMTLLDDETLEEVMKISFDGDYATTAGDGDNIYVMAHLAATDEVTGEKTESFPLSRTPTAEFLQDSAA